MLLCLFVLQMNDTQCLVLDLGRHSLFIIGHSLIGNCTITEVLQKLRVSVIALVHTSSQTTMVGRINTKCKGKTAFAIIIH